MQIEIAVKKCKELSDDELHRYAQLCEIEMVEYRKETKDYSPDRKLRHAQPWLQHLRDQKETFLQELRSRHEKQQSKV
jgi:hypothetical protein